MSVRPWIASLLVGAGLGSAVGFGVTWLLVVVQAARAIVPPGELASGDMVYPAHVVAAGTAMGIFLVVSATIALVRTSRRWAWAATLALVPSSLAWRWEDTSRVWSWIGLAIALVLAGALLVRGTEPARRPAARARRLAVGVPAAIWLALCLPSTVTIVGDVGAGDVPLMVHHVEDASMLGGILLGPVMTGAAAGLLGAAARRPVRRRSDGSVPVG